MNDKNQYITSSEAERAFYTAFVECDIELMKRIWSSKEITCIHPGGKALISREEIIGSWAQILLNAAPPDLRVRVISQSVTDNMAIHIVEECISSGMDTSSLQSIVLATNIYRQEAEGWRMVVHHASHFTTLPGEKKTSHTLQ